MSDPSLRRMFTLRGRSKPGTGSIVSILQRVVEGPKYATFWDLGRKLLELRQLTRVREQAAADYPAILCRAWSTAFERFTRGLVRDDAQQFPSTWRGLTDR